MREENIVERAIERKEIDLLLQGKGEYSLPDEPWSRPGLPIDWKRIVPTIHRQYEAKEDVRIREDFENALLVMLHGSAESVYCAVGVMYEQLLREKVKRSPFQIQRDFLSAEAHKAVVGKERDLRDIKKWIGAGKEDGLWEDMNRYRRMYYEKFQIVL